MPANRSTGLRASRLLVILALLVLFTGGIIYSARSIRYVVDGETTTEYHVAKLSLTHEVDWGADGRLTNPYLQAEAAKSLEPKSSVKPAGPSQAAEDAAAKPEAKVAVAAAKRPAVKKPAVKKPIAKKPTPKKPAPKKPVPKKPVPKKSAPKKPAPKAPAACPT